MGCGSSTASPIRVAPVKAETAPAKAETADESRASFNRRCSFIAQQVDPSSAGHKRGSFRTMVGSLPEHRIGQCSSHGVKPGANGAAAAKINQDRGLITYPFNDDPESALFVVLDGHGPSGEHVSEYLMWKLQELLLADAQGLKADPKSALIRAFEQADEQLNLSGLQTMASGAAIVLVLALKNTLWVAHVGDSRAVLATKLADGEAGGKPTVVALTTDHKPDSPEESARITRCGGFVSMASSEFGPARVWVRQGEGPGLAMSRSLGDTICKRAGVIATPTVSSYPLDLTKESAVLLASDGVWEFLDNDAAMSIALSFDTATDACVELIDESSRQWYEAEGNYRDDITAILLRFPLFPEVPEGSGHLTDSMTNSTTSIKIQPQDRNSNLVEEASIEQPATRVTTESTNDDAPPVDDGPDTASAPADEHGVAPSSPSRTNFEGRRLTVQSDLLSAQAEQLEQLRKQYEGGADVDASPRDVSEAPAEAPGAE